MIIIFIELCRIADSLLWIPKSSRRTSSIFYIPNIIALLKMESQQLSQNSPNLHGSAYASVTSKEVPSNQDPLAVSASNLPEFDRDSTKVNSQQETTPGTSAVPENHHHVSPQPASVPPPQNGQYQQHGMMTPNKAMASNWAHYQQPSMMTCSHYQTSPAYYQPDPHYPLPQYIPPLSTSSPDPID